MKRFIAILNDGSFINVPATRMEIVNDSILAYDENTLVAYSDIGFTLTAHVADQKNENLTKTIGGNKNDSET